MKYIRDNKHFTKEEIKESIRVTDGDLEDELLFLLNAGFITREGPMFEASPKMNMIIIGVV